MELETLQKIIAKILNVDTLEVTRETTFADDLGADSLDMYQILVEIEKNQGIVIDKSLLEQMQCVQDVLNYELKHVLK